ncbi:STAS domain-containing protein [Amycolatopsis sp. K13G38]|uniref:STAS domain-containing protein n=1 Tax=Amycolatopsis acididurans TaxID=2724524 RepID=A0ABX1JG74_9PSEU|nr:STAS domain-containing protein [Amycolatopsis acididurans]NKQ58613.1 STAS domain-containing protein [Amycolatopsis acididurans]
MTSPLTCRWSKPDARTGRVMIDGELDHRSADQLRYEVLDGLGASPGVREVHLDCARLGFCDSYGLSALLMIRREVDAAGAVLYLDNRGPSLDRLLRLTGTYDHLTGSE